MAGEFRYQIHQNAYIKLVLHALKHRTSAVNALLVGRSSGDGATVEIVESVPLFHSQIGLLAPLEIALLMIEEYYAEKGLSIVGYFHANERCDDNDLPSVAKNIGDHISRYFPRSALLLFDNRKLESLRKQKGLSPVVQLYTKDASSSWKLAGPEGSSQLALKEASANIVLLDYISSEKSKDIIDFDDHLDDISKDWLNAELFK